MNSEDKIEMLKWLSARNAHMATSDLAFLLGIPSVAEPDEDDEDESRVPVQ